MRIISSGSTSVTAACVAVALLVAAGMAAAQPPDTLWMRTYGGANIDIGHDVQQTADGGFIVAGYTRSYGPSGRNVWLVKTDSAGEMEWSEAYGGNNDDEGHAVWQASDGGYIVAGHTKSFGAGGMDVYLVRTDASGNELWSTTFGGPNDDEAYSVLETDDGGIVLAGVTSSYGAGSRDMWLIKTDAAGNPLWTRTHGGTGSDGAWSVSQASDGGFILAGWTLSYGGGFLGNAWLVKTDFLGLLEWQRPFGGSGVDRGYCALETSDGGYIMAGYTDSFGSGLYDMLMVKTDSEGTAEWIQAYGGSGRDYGHSVVETVDGGFLAAGYTLSYGAGGDDVWLVRTDPDGVLEWHTTYGGSSSDVSYSIANTSDGGYIVAGHTLSYGAGLHDVWLIRLAPDDAVCVELPAAPWGFLAMDVSPNPFPGAVALTYTLPMGSNVRLCVHDAQGRLVRLVENGSAPAGRRTVVWDGMCNAGRAVSPGVYFCSLEAGGIRAATRVVRVR